MATSGKSTLTADQVADIIQNAAERLWEITKQDPGKTLGIRFTLVATDHDVVEKTNSFDNIPAYEYSEYTIEADIVDDNTLTQVNEMGGQDKPLGGALTEPLDNMLKDMEKTQN